MQANDRCVKNDTESQDLMVRRKERRFQLPVALFSLRALIIALAVALFCSPMRNRRARVCDNNQGDGASGGTIVLKTAPATADLESPVRPLCRWKQRVGW